MKINNIAFKNSNVCTKEKVDCIISNVNDGDVIVQTLVDE